MKKLAIILLCASTAVTLHAAEIGGITGKHLLPSTKPSWQK